MEYKLNTKQNVNNNYIIHDLINKANGPFVVGHLISQDIIQTSCIVHI